MAKVMRNLGAECWIGIWEVQGSIPSWSIFLPLNLDFWPGRCNFAFCVGREARRTDGIARWGSGTGLQVSSVPQDVASSLSQGLLGIFTFEFGRMECLRVWHTEGYTAM